MEEFSLKDFGLRIKELRIRLNKTQDDIALDLGLTPGAISLYEKGKSKISMENLYSIAIKYGEDINWLLTGEKSRKVYGENTEIDGGKYLINERKSLVSEPEEVYNNYEKRIKELESKLEKTEEKFLDMSTAYLSVSLKYQQLLEKHQAKSA